jgi:hypothetical protein
VDDSEGRLNRAGAAAGRIGFAGMRRRILGINLPRPSSARPHLREMGAEEVPASSRRRAPVVAACAVIAVLALNGCGDDSEEETTPSNTELGPASAEGDIELSRATLRAENGYSTLVSTQITTRGDKDTLIAGQVALSDGSAEPALRLKVDGEKEPDATVDVTSDGGDRTALVSCACELPTGEHIVLIEGAAKGATGKVGARTLVVFPEVKLDDAGAAPVSGSALVTDETAVIPEGATLAETSSSGSGGGPLIVLASVAVPRTGTGSEDVRLEVLAGGDTSDELARTSIPSGKLVAYLDSEGAGDEVTLRGYTTAGRASIGVASLITCDCGLAR